MQLAIRDFLVDRRIVALPQDRGLIAASGEMAVDAVVRDVEPAVLEPSDASVLLEIDVLDQGREDYPVEALACSAQKPSESSTERLYISRYFASSECADLANAGGTAKILSGKASSDL
jgi:hypothetical protein